MHSGTYTIKNCHRILSPYITFIWEMPLCVKWDHLISGFRVGSELVGVDEQGRNKIRVIMFPFL